MPKRSQRRYHHGDLRAALVAAAREMVEAGEGDRLSLRGLARRAGVSPAAPYHHFGDRAGLMSELASEGFEALDAALDTACADCDDPETILATSCATYLRFAVEHGDHYRHMFSATYEDPERHARYHEVALASFGQLCAKVSAVDPSRASEDVVETALALWSMAHGMASLWLDGIARIPGSEQPLELERMATRLGQMALVLARPQPAPNKATKGARR